MNYLSHYRSLCKRSQQRKKYEGIYFEKHHIIPKCLISHKPKYIINGKWNLVLLTAREHFIAHMLLWKLAKKRYGENSHITKKLLYAWSMFFKKLPGRQSINNRSYENLRNAYSKGLTGKGNHMFGKTHTKETLDKMSVTRTGRKQSFYHISQRVKGRCHKTYKICKENGEQLLINNIQEFSRQYNYNHGAVYAILNNKRHRHKDIVSVTTL